MVRYSIALAGWILLSFTANVHAQLNSDELPSGLIQRSQNGQLKATVRLGAIPFGKTAKVQFRLANDTNSAIELGTGKTLNDQASLTLSSQTLPVGESAIIDVEFSVTGRISSEYQLLRATIVCENGSNIAVSCHYTVTGLLTFIKDRLMIEVNKKNAAELIDIRIPFIATAPANAANLRAQGLGDLSVAQCEVLIANGKPFVHLQLDRDSFPDSGLAGEIEIRDQVSETASQLPCLLYTAGEFEVGPQHLSFTWNQTRNCYEGNAIFRLLDYEQPNSSQNNKPFKLTARLSGLPGKINITETKIADHLPIYRLSVSIFPTERKPLEESEAPEQGTWRFEINGKTFTSPATATFFPPQNATHRSSQGECGKFFSALRANALSIQRFDVCIETEALRADNQDVRHTQRLILDTAEHRALLLRSVSIRKLGTGKQKLRLEAYLILDDKAWHRSIRTDLTCTTLPFDQSLKVFEFTNVQLIGAVPFPAIIGSDDFGEDDEYEFLIRNAKAYGKLEQNSRSAKIDIVLPPRNSGTDSSTSNRLRYSFDLNTLVPKSAEWGRLSVLNGTQLPYQPAERELYRWKEKEGIMLPTGISKSRVLHRRAGEEFRAENSFRETKLHWNSVNQPLPEHWWTPERWADVDEIRKQCAYPTSE